MSTDSGCPPDEVFLALKAGDDVPPAVHAHLESCPDCQRRFAELGAAIRSLQELESDGTILDEQHLTLERGDSSEMLTRQDEPGETVGRPARRDLELDDYLGRFRLIRLLGKGAFGEVHLAEDPHLDRKVAIKLAPQRKLVNRSGVDRFQREAQAAAQLRHPNIIPVYDVGKVNGINYIVYEFVAGQTLRAVLHFRSKLPQEEAVTLLTKLARAVDYAHSNGIVHRDIKPDNILIDQDGEPHIADFGLAYRDESETLRTREGILMGTPAYMSPEQASGRGHDVDARADIWSLGVLMQEVLTGERPFEGPLNSILTAIQHGDPKPITDDTISPDLTAICQTCLAKDANARYPRAGELADDLDRWARSEPVSVRERDPLGRFNLWARRNPTVAALTATVVATLAMGVIVASYFAIDANRKAESLEREQQQRALAQIGGLRTADPDSLPFIISSLRPHRNTVLPRLREIAQQASLSASERARLRTGLAVLDITPPTHEQLAALRDDLTAANGEEFLALRQLLLPFAEQLQGELWVTVLEGDKQTEEKRFRAECALALYDPESVRWSDLGADVAAQLLVGNSASITSWATALRPVREHLLPALRESFRAGDDDEVKNRAAQALSDLFDDQPELLLELVLAASPAQLSSLLPKLPPHAEQATPQLVDTVAAESSVDVTAQANAVVALLYLERPDLALPLLAAGDDNTLRTLATHRFGPAGIAPNVIISALELSEVQPTVMSGLLLSLGEYRAGLLNRKAREQLRPDLVRWFREHPDSGVHSAAEWLLRRWGFEQELADQMLSLQSRDARDGRNWFINRQNQTLAIVDGETDTGGDNVESPHTFAISTTEVTNAEYAKYRARSNSEVVAKYSPDADGPAIDISWYDAAKYCRWLSEQEEIPEDQMCFPAIDEIGPEMLPSSVHLDRSGYRLPTAAEWEWAARAGTLTDWHHGSRQRMHRFYSHFAANSQNRTWPVARLKPNSAGLFDVYGNAHEWCQNPFEVGDRSAVASALTVDAIVTGTFELRGGAFLHPPALAQSDWRDEQRGHIAYHEFGFRVARTYNRGNGGD